MLLLLLASTLQLLGLVVLSVGAWLLVPWFGCVVAGICIFFTGYYMEPRGVVNVPQGD